MATCLELEFSYPYFFSGINENSEKWLRDIFRELDLKTCIHFRESATGHYVNFQKGNDGYVVN